MNKLKKGCFVTSNVPVSLYSTLNDSKLMPSDTVYQVTYVNRTGTEVRIYHNQCGSRSVNPNTLSLVDGPKPVVKVGDIFDAHWGYEQTNVDYYMVVKVTGKSAWLASLPQTRSYDGPMSGTTSPVLKHPSELGPGKQHRIKVTGNGTPCFRLNSYSHAFPCRPDTKAFFSEWH
mgnify:CR=1 FL=1